jgi:hypothetical protein
MGGIPMTADQVIAMIRYIVTALVLMAVIAAIALLSQL